MMASRTNSGFARYQLVIPAKRCASSAVSRDPSGRLTMGPGSLPAHGRDRPG
jgi:hypothetical protein